MNDIMRKPRMGLLMIASPRFKSLGEGTEDGTYAARKEQEARRIVEAGEKFAEVIFPNVIYDRNQLDVAMNLFYNRKVDCILALYLSWAEDFAWVRFLRDAFEVPILFGCIVKEQCSFTDTTDENEFVEFLSAGNLVGTLEASGSLARFDRKMVQTAIGSFNSIMKRAAIFAQASKVRSILRNTNFGLLASYNEVMWSTYVDPYNLFVSVGPELKFLSVATLEDEINIIPEKEAASKTNMMLEKYPVLPDVDKEKLLQSVKASMAVENLARKMNIDMVVLNDIDPVLFQHVGLRPGFTPCPGTEDVSVVPEGDIGAGLAVYILKILSGKHVNFIEPFYIDKESGCFAAGHAGPNDYTDPKGSVKLARDVRFAKTSYKYAGAPFAWYVIPPGEKTMVHISECGGKYKLVCTLVDAIECKHFLTSYSHGLFKPRIPVNELFRRLLEIGVTQHYGLVEGNYIKELEDFAHIMGYNYYFIK